METPLAVEAFKHALGEYAMTLAVDMAAPGAASLKLAGAREVLQVLRSIGEPVKPTFPVDAAKGLVNPDKLT